MQVENLRMMQLHIPKSITLTIVCKKHNLETILPLIQAGHCNFAENYIQEAQEKWQTFLEHNQTVNLKLVGGLQSNKIKDALLLFHEVHSVDNIKKAEKIAKSINSQTKTKTFYTQVNIGREPQKNGINPDDVLDFMKSSPVEISGLMCIPPANTNPDPYFQEMSNIRKSVEDAIGKKIILSMGMSGDFKQAIAFGSDEIRIGTAILGER